jgi:hypothetical protein
MTKFFPNHPVGYFLIGRAAMKQKNKAKALKYFEKAKTLVEVDNVPWLDRMIEEAKKLD